MNAELTRSVSDAVSMVNEHAGAACVRLWFADDPAEIDFVASSASLAGDQFQFRSGFETYAGVVGDLRQIKVDVIGRPN